MTDPSGTPASLAPSIRAQIDRDIIAGKQRRVEKLKAALRAILDADHNGPPGALVQARADAAKLVDWQPSGPPRSRCVEAWEDGPHGFRGGIEHGPGSPIPDLVREEPPRKRLPRPWQRPVDPTIEAEDPA